MTKIALLCSLFVFAFATAYSLSVEDSVLNNPDSRVYFTENRGQWNEEINYAYKSTNFEARFLPHSVSFVVQEKNDSSSSVLTNVWSLQFSNTDPHSLTGKENQGPEINYYQAKNRFTNVQSYQEVWHTDIYPDTDIRFYGLENGAIEYDILLKPRADLNRISFTLDGVKNLHITSQGKLAYQVGEHDFFSSAPIAYQVIEGKRKAVKVDYVLNECEVTYVAEPYDPDFLLVIDPVVLEFSTFIGGGLTESIQNVHEYNGDFYVQGTTSSVDFPTDPGAYQLTNYGMSDFVFTLLDTLGQVKKATYLGGSGDESDWNPVQTLMVNGNFILFGLTYSSDFPLTPSPYQTAPPFMWGTPVFVKLNANLQLIYSSYIGEGWGETPVKLLYQPASDVVYGLGETFGAFFNLPVTHPHLSTPLSSSFSYLFKFDNSSNTIPLCITLTGNWSFSDNWVALTDAGGIGIHCVVSPNGQLPVTAGALPTTPNPSDYSSHIMVLNTEDSLVFGTSLGAPTGYSFPSFIKIKDNQLYAVGTTNSDIFPVTPGAFQPLFGGVIDMYICKVDLTSQSVIYSSYLGGSLNEYENMFDTQTELVDDYGNIYVCGKTFSTDFPVTPSAIQPMLNGGTVSDLFITKIDSAGSIKFSTYLGSASAPDGISNTFVDDAGLTLIGSTNGPDFPITSDPFKSSYAASTDLVFVKISSEGSLKYSSYIGGSGSDGYVNSFREPDGIYIIGSTNSTDFSTTPGAFQTSMGGTSDHFILKFDTTDHVAFSTYFGSTGTETLFDYKRASNFNFIHENRIHLLTSANKHIPTTNGAIQSNLYTGLTDTDIHYARLDASTGNMVYGTFLGGVENDVPKGFFAFGKNYYLFGNGSRGFPITEGAYQEYNAGMNDWVYAHFSECPKHAQNDTIVPDTQTVCRYSTPFPLTAPPYQLDSLPNLIRDITLTPHPQPQPVDLQYQWLQSSDGGMTWSAAPGGIGQNYTPTELSDTTWFKRIVMNCCGDTIGYSEVSVALVLPEIAPVADAGDSLYICQGGSIQLGGTTTGGLPPYSYHWSPSDSLSDDTLAQPIASPTETTVYVLEITDSQGCTHFDQATVHVLETDAGPDVENCAGQGVLIGTGGFPGVSGITYSWNPTTGLNNPNIAQPTAAPIIETDYELTVTGPDGCPLIDTVTVTPISFPSAGNTATVCWEENVLLGNPSLPGYSYSWVPSLYLDNPNLAQPTFYTGTPTESFPMTYTVNIFHDATGCYTTQELEVYLNYVDAGPDVCTPSTPGDTFPVQIGTSDYNGGMANYEWTVLSGDPTGGHLSDSLSATSIINPTVATSYELISIFNGTTCSDQISVGVGCPLNGGPPSPGGGGAAGCPIGGLTTISEVDCAIADTLLFTSLAAQLNNFNPTLHFYSWSPTTDLATPDSNSTLLTNNFLGVRWYYFQVFSVFDSALFCQDSIALYGENTQFPQAHALDTIICEGEAVVIGANLPQTDKIYHWTPADFLNTPYSMNPSANPPVTMSYVLTVTDTLTGCSSYDTATVTVRGVGANAGPDQIFCDGAVVTLGSPPQPHRTYHWEPSTSLSQPDIAQPTDTIYGDITYILTVTDTITGCTLIDSVSFTESLSPQVNISTSSYSICEGAQITLAPDTVISGYIYSWSPTTGLNNPGTASVIATPLNSTLYQLVVTDGNALGCYASDQVMVNVTAGLAPHAEAGPDTSVCLGSSVQLGAPDEGHTYSWSPTTDLSDPASSNPVATPSSTTTYTLLVTDINGCTNTDMVEIVVATPPVSTGYSMNRCQGQLTNMGPWHQPGYTYDWSPSGDFSNPNLAQQTFFPQNETTYYLSITGPEGCTHVDTYAIQLDTIEVDAGPDLTFCQDSVQIGSPSLSGYTYNWSPNFGMNDNTLAQPTAFPNLPTDYILTVQANGCTVKDTVKVRPAIEIQEAEDVTICPGSSIQIGPIDPGGLSFMWNENYMISSQSISQPFVSPLVDTVYTLEITDGTCTLFDTVQVFVDEFAVDAGSPTILCPGMCISIGTPAVPNHLYQWTPSTGLSDPTIAEPIACPTSTTTYTLWVRDLATGCEATDQIVVVINSSPPPPCEAGPSQYICPGESTFLGAPPTPSVSYFWTPNTSLSHNNQSVTQANPSQTTTYILTAVNDTNSCTTQDTVTVFLLTPPDAPNLSDITICENSSSLIGTSDPALSYHWFPSTGLSNDTIGSPIAYPLDTTHYLLVVTDAAGCTATSEMTVNVAPGSGFTAEAGPDITMCRFDTVRLGTQDQGGGAVYSWTPTFFLDNPTVSDPSVMPTGFFTTQVYQLTVTLGECISTDEVTVSALPQITLDAGPDIITCDEEIFLNGSSPSPGLGTWSMLSGPNSPVIESPNTSLTQITGLIPGIYAFQLASSGDICNPGTDYVTVEVHPAPLLIITDPAPDCGAIDLTASEVTSGSTLFGANLSYWVDAAMTQPIADPTQVDISGTYYIHAQNGLTACAVTQPVNVLIDCSAPLVFELFNLVAKKEGGITLLQWNIAQNIELDHFEIERSIDGVSFQTIGSSEASSEVSGIQVYHGKDTQPVSGINYYRILAVTQNGNMVYSNIQSVLFEDDLLFTLFPNPSEGHFWLRASSEPAEPIRVSITTIHGQILFYRIISPKEALFYSMDLSKEASGTYLVTIESQTRKIFIR